MYVCMQLKIQQLFVFSVFQTHRFSAFWFSWFSTFTYKDIPTKPITLPRGVNFPLEAVCAPSEGTDELLGQFPVTFAQKIDLGKT